MLCPGAPLWYAHVAFELYYLGYGGWKTFLGMATIKWFSNNEDHISEYAMGIGENWSLGGRRRLSKLVPGVVLLAGRGVVGVAGCGSACSVVADAST